MASMHNVSPLIRKMSKEVFKLFVAKEKFSLAAFKPAFAKVAHNHEILHRREPHQYNYHFQQVMKEVKRLIGEHNRQHKEVKAPSTVTTPRPQQPVVIPIILPKRSKYDLTGELF